MYDGALKLLRDILFPADFTCDICGIEIFDGHICKDCLKTLEFNNGAVCPVCGRKTVRAEICLECKAQLPKYKKAVSPVYYGGNGIVLLRKFKSGGAYLKEYFADLITEKLVGFPQIDILVSVPTTKRSERKRGYDQTALIAKEVALRTKTPYIKGAVIKVRDTAVQKGLTKKERAENLKGCFKADKSAVADKRVLIIDDILTTGATANEVAETLLKAGAKEVYLATVASVEYKPPEIQ